mgnify:CR=1 FL=1
MKINSFALTKPDSDNEMCSEMESELTNEGQEDIRLIKMDTILTNADGVGVAVSIDDEEEIRIRPGDTEIFSPGLPWVKTEIAGTDDPAAIKAEVYASFYRREFIKLGEMDCPADHETPVMMKADATIGGVSQSLVVMASRTEPDEDDESTVEVRCIIRNTTDMPLEKVSLKAELVDDEGAEIDECESAQEIRGGGISCLDPGFWNQSVSELKNARIKLSLAVFTPVDRVMATATGPQADEED